MTQATLPLSAPPAKVTLCDRLASYFQARSGEWIDGRSLGNVAGAYGWRSRVSNLRKPPYGMQIDNRQRRVHRSIVIDGVDHACGSYVISEYRYVPEGHAGGSGAT